MKTIEITGFKRANLGKSEAKKLRQQGYAPCVLYGGKEQIHFYSHMFLFKDLVYTSEICFVNLNIEGHVVRAIMQDLQFHPVSEVILHIDFLQIFEDKLIKMKVPLKTVGSSPGVFKGGKLILKKSNIDVEALPKDMPDFIDVDISKMELGSLFKVKQLTPKNYRIITPDRVNIASVEVPRAMKGQADATGTESTDKATPAPAPAAKK